MRKELVYSLLAVAAGPLVPVTVNAAVVPTDAVQDENWTGADKVTSGTVYISTGNPISCDLGTLEIGKYQLIIGSFSATTDITVTVKGQSKTFKASEGKGTVEFELSSKEAVTFTITPAVAADCQISGVELSLDADFEGIAKTLLSLYNNAYDAVSGYGYAADDNTEVLKITKQLSDINKINNVKKGDENAYEDVYKVYKLWLGAENTDMYKNIVAAQQAAEPKEIAYQANNLETSLKATKALLDDKKTPAYAKEGTLDDYKKSGGTKGLTAKYNDLVSQKDSYKNGSKVEGYAAIATEITDLDNNIKKAQTAGGNNNTAYNTVKKAIEEAQANYQDLYKTVTTTDIPERLYYDKAGKNVKADADRNATLRAEAVAEMQAQLDLIGKVSADNEENYEAGTSESYEAKGEYTTKLAEVDAALKAIQTAYQTHVSKLAALDDQYAEEYTNVAKAKADNKVAIEKNGKGVADAVKTMDNALAALLKDINDNNTSKKVDALDVTDKVTAVEDAITKLNDLCKDITANEQANTAMNDEVAKLNKTLSDYVAAINKAKYQAYDPIADNYKADYDYVVKLGTDLTAAIKAAYDKSGAVDYQKGDYATKKAEYSTAIENLNTAITADQANYKAVYDAINGKSGARAAYTALLNKVKDLTIYTSTDEKEVYSKAWMDAELKKITDVEDAITKALSKKDGCADIVVDKNDKGEHQSLIQALKKATVDAVTTELNAKNIDADITAANDKYEKDLATKALDNLWTAVNTQLADMNKRIDALEKGCKDNAYGLTEEEISDKLDKIVKEYKDLDNDRNGEFDGGKDVDKLSDAQEAIDELEVSLSDLESLAESAAAKVKANNKALEAFNKAIANLNKKYSDTLDAAEKADKDSKTNWIAAFENAKKAIEALGDGKVIVDKTVKDSYEKETLQASDYSEKVKAIETQITNAKTIADNAQNNFKANADLEKLYADVNKAVTDAKTKTQKADATAYTNYYQDQFENAKTGYEKALADINKKIADAKTQDATIATAKPASADKMSAALKASLTTELNNLKTAVGKVEAAAKANLAAYNKQKVALEGNKDVKGAKPTYTEVSLLLASKDETTETKKWKADMNGYNDDLIAKEEDVEAYYKKGASQTTGEDVDKLTDAINDIKSDIEIIRGKINGEYDASVQADNEAKLQEIREAIAAAKKAFQEANEYTAQFMNLDSELFSEAIASAEESAPGLNTALSAFPSKIDAAEAQAQKDFDAVNATPKVWDSTADKKAVTDLTDDINAQLDNYKAAVKKGLDKTYNGLKSNYDKQYNDARTEINNFTLDGSALAPTKIDGFLKDVADLIANIDTEYKALNVAKLDELAVQANNSLKSMINADITNAADAVIRPLLNDCDQIVTDGQAYLTGDDLKTFNKDLENYNNYKSWYNDNFNYNSVNKSKFSIYRDFFKDFKATNRYTTVLGIDKNYDLLQELISEREASLAAATTEIEAYAAAGTLKKGALADIQAAIDKVKEDVEEAKGTADINKYIDVKKKGSKVNDDYSALQTVDAVITTAKTTGLKTAEGNYLTSALNDVTSAYYDFEAAATTDEAKAKAAEYKDQIENAKTGLKTRLNADIKDAKKTAKDLLPYEKEISDLLAEINNANSVDNSAVVDELNTKIAAVEAKADLSNYDETVQEALAEQLNDLKAEIAKVKETISTSENIAFDKDNIDNTITALDKEADALIEEAQKEQKVVDQNAFNESWAANYMSDRVEDLEELLSNNKDRLDNEYEYVSTTTFQTKLGQIATAIANLKADAEKAIAEGKAYEFRSDNNNFTKPYDDIITDIKDVMNSAAKRELKAVAEKLRADVDAITYNKSDYTDGDAAKIQALIDAVSEKIGKDSYFDEKTKTTVKETGLFNTAKDVTDNTLDENKEKAADYAQDIEDILDLIKSQTNVVEEPEVVPGNITGGNTGDASDVDLDDYDKFVEDMMAGNLPKPGDANFYAYDANGDGLVNVADLVAIMNLANGLNADGSLPSAARVKDNVSIEGTLNAMTQTRNGVTRLAIVLDANAEFTAFQMDVQLPAGARIVSESLGESTQGVQLLSNDLANGAHRILGISTNGNITNGNVLYIDVEGNGQVDFSNIYFSTAQAQSVSFTIGGTTGINGLTADQQQQTESFDLSGRLANSWQKGVNIVRDAMGNVKKVFKK